MRVAEVFVAGAGLMGSGIAQVCAQAGLAVHLFDLDPDQVDQALENIRWSVDKLVAKGKVAGSVDEVMARISPAADLAPAAGADLVMEVVFEDLEAKRRLYRELAPVVSDEALVASNTSAIPISQLAAHAPDPQRFLGLHFFSPAPMMGAVEVIRGGLTTREVFAAGGDFVRAIGKEPIMVQRDVPGFVLNRINFPSTIEAMRLVEAGVATVEDIDKGLRLAMGRRMGIFETGDMVGLDVTHGALMAMYQETGEPRWFPPLLLRRKVAAGQLGRKTGVGWYRYDDQGRRLGPAED